MHVKSFRVLLNLMLAWQGPRRTSAWVVSMLLNSKWVGLVGKKAVLAFFPILFVLKVFVLSVQEWLETKIGPYMERTRWIDI